MLHARLPREPRTADQAATAAHALKAPADPARLRLVWKVTVHEGGEACVCDLTEPAQADPAPRSPATGSPWSMQASSPATNGSVWACYAPVPGILRIISAAQQPAVTELPHTAATALPNDGSTARHPRDTIPQVAIPEVANIFRVEGIASSAHTATVTEWFSCRGWAHGMCAAYDARPPTLMGNWPSSGSASR